jgi:hypothetical protein
MSGASFVLFTLLASTALAQSSPLHVTIAAPDRLGGNSNATVQYSVENTTDAAVNDVRFDLHEFQEGFILSYAAPGWNCALADPPLNGNELRCAIPSLGPHVTSRIEIVHHFFAPYLRTGFVAYATIGNQPSGGASLDAAFYRYSTVTTASDDGPGSLRQAIADVNANCSFAVNVKSYPCKIAFQIGDALPTEGWFTIAPESPLPAIVANDVAVDGESQTAIADSNPLGPEIFLLGEDAGAIDGLRFRGSRLLLRGLAIGGFAQNGLLVQGNGAILNNYLGVDPTGRRAVPNGLRGLMASGSLQVIGNVISGNRRSGIFFANESGPGVTVTNNRIGVAAATDDPLPNGASGIFFGELSRPALVSDNVIGNSGDFGIAIARTSQIGATHNRIFNSGQSGIDVGLDGPTSDAYTPSITSVHYDAATGTTTISGTTFSRTPGFTIVEFYANKSVNAAGFAQAEDYLGSVKVPADTTPFTFTVARDLRGLFVDAAAVIQIYPWDIGETIRQVTTELGRAVLVQ